MDFVPTEEERLAADAVLGEEHPLARSLSRHRTISRQAAVAATPLPGALAATLIGIDVALVVLGVTAVVVLVYIGTWVGTRRALLDRTQELIALDDGPRTLPVIARERRRLVSRGERERLARCLEHALADAWNWERTPPRSRPLEGTQFLRDSAAEVTAIVKKLRAKRVRPQGVALISRLLGDGGRSPLYAGDPDRLREELGRIRYLLEPRAQRSQRDQLHSPTRS
jgi:hypothetical protein